MPNNEHDHFLVTFSIGTLTVLGMFFLAVFLFIVLYGSFFMLIVLFLSYLVVFHVVFLLGVFWGCSFLTVAVSLLKTFGLRRVLWQG